MAPAGLSIRRTVSDWGIRGVSAFGAAACRLVGPRTDGQFGILLYHRIADEVAGVRRPSMNVPPAQFEQQIRGLVQAGFVFWPLRRVLALVARGERIPPYVVVLTFDDGFEGTYRHSWPVLRELNVPATVFLATAYLDSEEPFPFDDWGQRYSRSIPPVTYRPLNIAQCRELAGSGLIEFGAHTHTHADFRGRPNAFRADLETNIAKLNELFGTTDVTFAFPYGTPYLGFANASLTDVAREVGTQCGLTTHGSLIHPDDSPFAWGRFTAFPWDNASTLAAKLGGWYGWAPDLKNRLLGRLATSPAKLLASATPPVTEYAANASPQSRPTISVIMPTFNRAGWLADALASLSRQQTGDRFAMEIVVCDNASTDATADVVAAAAKSSPIPIRYCCQSKPGDAPTRNRALREAVGEWLAFFDDDQIAPENWLSELYAAVDKTSGSIIGGAVQLDLTAEQRDEFGSYLRVALRETELYPRLQPYLRQALPGTGNALVSRSVFEAIGNFDESFVGGGSDHDFFARARAAGFALWYAPQAVIRHRVEPRRLSTAHLRRDSLSGGAGYAEQVDFKRRGLSWTLGCGLARIAQALLVHAPSMLAARLRRDRGQVLGHRIRLWRTEGYLRRCLALAAPRLFPQQDFFDTLSYGHGRPGTETQKQETQVQEIQPVKVSS
ncbi:MAG: glycosyltransferase [Planctomycetota bacterium]